MSEKRCFWCGYRTNHLLTAHRETNNGTEKIQECDGCNEMAHYYELYVEHRTAMARMLLYLPEPRVSMKVGGE